ncbi:hypothetical protein QTI66_27045 [Variovorax sp. J22R133]|uniref:hypothetical protein n=1 Tax=Variovorax brevis TaxID=3053503 RepID=UPI002574B7B8|nr:hypothetical protein [Variovorax sp. J22R133]MDM0115835.1 hypothetical protein [Variovorax sp. J22R133]
MQPHLEIRRIGAEFFAYSVRAGRAPARHGEEDLASLEHCLNDAGDSLGHYFPAVKVSLDGLFLGSYDIGQLLRNPTGLAVELMGKLSRAERAHALA